MGRENSYGHGARAAAHELVAAAASAQEIRQRPFERLVGCDASISRPEFLANQFRAPAMRGQSSLIFGPRRYGIDVDVLPALQILKEHRTRKLESHLVGIKR